jgi:pyridoxal/pyridoxine/pyridoxamine kinase
LERENKYLADRLAEEKDTSKKLSAATTKLQKVMKQTHESYSREKSKTLQLEEELKNLKNVKDDELDSQNVKDVKTEGDDGSSV